MTNSNTEYRRKQEDWKHDTAQFEGRVILGDLSMAFAPVEILQPHSARNGREARAGKEHRAKPTA
ncbi:MAG: hypothetical protein Q7R50_06920 [Dehalococcoidales bacterium]|nr:hypothetical protein [Dehalococcoidales bacterium]